MDKVSDAVTSLFHIAVRDNRPVVCASADDAIVWGDIFGLGWRLGVAFDPHGWFAKATVSVSLRTDDKDARTFKERVTTITDFGRGQPALLGTWSPLDLSLRPYVSLTVTAKARFPQPASDPLSSVTLALHQSMESGDFVDTKFYAFSTKPPGTTAGKPRVVYANNSSLGLMVPKYTSGTKRAKGVAPSFLVNMTSDHHITRDSVLHEYEYQQDSDLDDDDDDPVSDVDLLGSPVPGQFHARSSSTPHISGPAQGRNRGSVDDELPAEPPAYSVSACRIVLVKGIAYKTWVSYIYFRYTGQVYFHPLKSAQGSSDTRRPDDPTHPPTCSPKSMYRLAAAVGDEKLKELAFRAIKAGLSKDNIVHEAFSWFTAQYLPVTEHEVDRVYELRKAPEVSSALKLQLKAVSIGEKPWAQGVLIAIMDKLNPSE